MTAATAARQRRHWWGWLGALAAAAIFAWVLRRFDLDRIRSVLAEADPRYLLLLLVAVIGEQLVGAWKWRRILRPLRSVPTLRLFGATMAGYLAGLLAPFGLSPLVRSGLVARLEGLTMSAVLASLAIDRLIDGVAFAGVVLFVVVFAAIPGASGDIRFGLAVAATGSLGAIVTAFILLWRHKQAVGQGAGWVLGAADRLPRRFAPRARGFALAFAKGILWPAEPWRRGAIVAASLMIKLIAATDLLWAGLAFGVLLPAVAYLVLLAILGFIVVLAQFARVPGGFFLGAVFTLGLFGVGEPRALAMVTTVVAASLFSVGVVGALTLWRHGIALSELGTREIPGDGRV